uniref:Uncharacterized protein n=1 Tax=Echeneis naucrates TaxID=173247 RepID=A0A665VS54_ECHNA
KLTQAWGEHANPTQKGPKPGNQPTTFCGAIAPTNCVFIKSPMNLHVFELWEKTEEPGENTHRKAPGLGFGPRTFLLCLSLHHCTTLLPVPTASYPSPPTFISTLLTSCKGD